MPITWQNISGNTTDPGHLLRGAAGTIDNGFDRLMKIISDRQEVNQGVADRAQEAQVLNAKELLGRLKDPNQVADAQPQLDAIRASLNPRFRSQLVGAEDARTASLQDMFTKRLAYEHANTDENQHPLVQEFRRLQAKDPVAAQGYLDQHPEIRNVGDLAKEGHLASREDEKFKREGEQTAAQIQRWKDETGIGNRQIDETARGHNISLFGSLVDAGGAGGGKGAGGSAGGSPDGNAQSLTTALTGLFKDDPGKAQVMSRLVAEAMDHKDPKQAGLLRMLPQDVVLRAVEKHMSDAGTGKYNPFDMFAASNIQKTLLGELDNPSVQQEMARDAQSRIRAQERSQENSRLRQTLIGQLFPGASTAPAKEAQPPADASEAGVDYSGKYSPETGGKGKFTSMSAADRANFDPAYLERKLAEEQGKQPAVAVVPEAAMPSPAHATLRLNNPADSVAGRAETRAFAEQQAELLRKGAQEKVQREDAGKAKERADALLSSRDVRALSRFQVTPAFELLDKKTKARIFSLVNNG